LDPQAASPAFDGADTKAVFPSWFSDVSPPAAPFGNPSAAQRVSASEKVLPTFPDDGRRDESVINQANTTGLWMGSTRQPSLKLDSLSRIEWPDGATQQIPTDIADNQDDVDGSRIDFTVDPAKPADDAPTAWQGPTSDTDQELDSTEEDYRAFERAAWRQSNAVRPLGGRDEGALTRFLETHLLQRAKDLYELFTLPMRPSVPVPPGLQETDSGEYLIDGKPALDTTEGREFFEDQRQRREWPARMALEMLTLGRLPNGAPPGAIGTFVGRGNGKRASATQHERALALTYRDRSKTLKQLQDAVATERPGTDIHHVVEQTSARYHGFSEKLIESAQNKVRIPRMKHWEISGWYQTYNNRYGMSPREYLHGKSWQVRYQFGLKVLRRHGVLVR
jgi:hypothetical protein